MCKREVQIFVFDLDFTIWNAGDTFCSETNPPYMWEEGKLLDRSERCISLYPDVIKILQTLQKSKKVIAVASRTNEPTYAIKLMQVFDIDKYFDIKEIYPGSKIEHLKKIQKQVNCPFGQIAFFDDEDRNIVDAKSLGIMSVLVNNGITFIQIEEFLA